MTILAAASTYVDLPEPDFLFEKPLPSFDLSVQQIELIRSILASEGFEFNEESV